MKALLELGISGAGATYVSVVVREFFEGHDAILYLGVPQAHELHEEISLGSLTADNIWVLSGIKLLGDVVKLYASVFVYVKLGVSFFDCLKSCLTHLSLIHKRLKKSVQLTFNTTKNSSKLTLPSLFLSKFESTSAASSFEI